MRAPSGDRGTHADLVNVVSHVATDNKGLSLYIYRIRCKIKQREYRKRPIPFDQPKIEKIQPQGHASQASSHPTLPPGWSDESEDRLKERDAKNKTILDNFTLPCSLYKLVIHTFTCAYKYIYIYSIEYTRYIYTQTYILSRKKPWSGRATIFTTRRAAAAAAELIWEVSKDWLSYMRVYRRYTSMCR